jgi:D-amino-acid oxidase
LPGTDPSHNSSSSVAVLGGGISGITCALYLREKGFLTTLYTHLRADDVHDRSLNPQFASLFPAALIVPHMVEMPDLPVIFARSQSMFEPLAGLTGSGIRWQEHYELEAGAEAALPTYAPVLHNLEPYTGAPHQLRFHEALGDDISGWVAKVLFAETPMYLRYLYDRYLNAGGELRIRELSREEIPNLPEEWIVNCTGLWARDLFDDQRVRPNRGALLFVEGGPFPPRADGSVFSYNYVPPDDQYLYDVYCFPRSGGGSGSQGWLLGGSREHAVLENGKWVFPRLSYEHRGGVPLPLYELNRTIMRRLTGADIANYPLVAYAGFRPVRIGGVRLERSEHLGRTVIHNYGHGGAGVALSWGCAWRVEQLLQEAR